MTWMTWQRARRGFTLVEIMVVVSIIALLVAILLPAVQSVREGARRVECANKMKQVALALLSYQESQGAFPPGNLYHAGMQTPSRTSPGNWCQYPGGPTNRGDWGYSPWTTQILPQIEEQALFDRLTFGFVPEGRFMAGDFVVPPPIRDSLTPLKAYQCPSSKYPQVLRNNYFGIQGGGASPSCTNRPAGVGRATQRHFFHNGVLYAHSRVTFGHVVDGASNVLLLGETNLSHVHPSSTYDPSEVPTWATGGKTGLFATPMQMAGMSNPINTIPDTLDPVLNYASQQAVDKVILRRSCDRIVIHRGRSGT